VDLAEVKSASPWSPDRDGPQNLSEEAAKFSVPAPHQLCSVKKMLVKSSSSYSI